MTKRRRSRLYPRCLDILRKLSEPGARLSWNRIDGRYRINGQPGRESVVIQRTRLKMLRLKVVRPTSGENPDLLITDAGRQALRMYELRQTMGRGRCKRNA